MAKRKKTPPEVWERQEENLRRMRRLLEKRVADDERIRAAREKAR
jgi:hypothetical protein